MISKGKCIASLVLGVCGLVFWLVPLFGYPITIVGLVFGIMEMKKGAKGMAIAGFILSIIGLVLTIANSAVGAYLGATGQLF